MKFTITFALLFAGILPIVAAETASVTTTTTSRLRGNKVVRTRTVHPHHTEEGLKPQNRNHQDPLVDPQHHHRIRLKGTSEKGEVKSVTIDLDKLEDQLPHDAEIFQHYHHQFHSDNGPTKAQDESAHMRGLHAKQSGHHSIHHNGHRSEDHLRHHHAAHFNGHEQAEHQHHPHPHHHHIHHEEAMHNKEQKEGKKAPGQKKRRRDRSLYSLPTGLDQHFNDTLFEVLHDAPFHIFEDAMGHELDDDESFPVFSVPQWLNSTGVFTGFSKTATPLIFENAQFLLHWHDIVAASSGASEDLEEYMTDHNFHASLIIGKVVGNSVPTNFLGMVVSYFQYGAEKNVLVPFAQLENFFDDTSEQHLLDPDTKSLELQALHEMLDEKRSNSTQFYHPALASSEERKQQLEDLEIIHFQKLFQLLIRRSFLFSFGYADCLMSQSDDLRSCMDDTFYAVIKMETSVRGALDDQIIEQLAEINDNFHSKVSEACVSIQGSGTGMLYGSGSCKDANDLTAFVSAYASF